MRQAIGLTLFILEGENSQALLAVDWFGLVPFHLQEKMLIMCSRKVNDALTGFWFFISLFVWVNSQVAVNAALPLHDGDGNQLPSLAPMLEEVNPAVVNISTYSTLRRSYNPLLNDPFFRHFFNS